MNSWKRPLRQVLGLVGYSMHRWPTNRSDGMQDALLPLRRSGYSSGVIIDAGANVGNWQTARSICHDATIHLVKPQPACQAALDDLSRSTPGLTVHPVAITEPGIDRVWIVRGAAWHDPANGNRVRWNVRQPHSMLS